MADELLGPARHVLDQRVLTRLYEAEYDTAIREASIQIELALREASGSQTHGQLLLGECFDNPGYLVSWGLPNPSRQILRNAFRSYFKFVRNEYAHTFPAVDLPTACRLARRSAALLEAIRILKRVRSL